MKRVVTGVFDPALDGQGAVEVRQPRAKKSFLVEVQEGEDFPKFSPIRATPSRHVTFAASPAVAATPAQASQPVRMIASPWGTMMPSLIDLLEQDAEIDRFNESLAELSINESLSNVSFSRQVPPRPARRVVSPASTSVRSSPLAPLSSFYDEARRKERITLLDVADPADAEAALNRLRVLGDKRLDDHWAWARQVEDAKGAGVRPVAVRDLTAEEKEMYDRIMSESRNADAVVTLEAVMKTFDMELKKSDVWRLRPSEWLNDESINLYFKMIQKRADSSKVALHCFNSFFYQFLIDEGYAKVRRWSRGKDLFVPDMKILFPVHLGNHWCLGVINMKEKRLEYYDSLFGDNAECFQAMRDYVSQEHQDKKKRPFDWTGWTEVVNPAKMPRQTNGSDCGVFASMFAECMSRDVFPSFAQSDMPNLRKIMTLELVTGTFLSRS